jgi:hypothetical protein
VDEDSGVTESKHLSHKGIFYRSLKAFFDDFATQKHNPQK